MCPPTLDLPFYPDLLQHHLPTLRRHQDRLRMAAGAGEIMSLTVTSAAMMATVLRRYKTAWAQQLSAF